MKVFGLFLLLAVSIITTLVFYVLIGLPSVWGGEQED